MRLRSAIIGLCLPGLLMAQSAGDLTLESLFSPSKRVQYLGGMPSRLTWAPDGSLIQAERKNGKVTLLRVDPKTWDKKPLFEADKLLGALKDAGAPESEAAKALNAASFSWNDSRSAFVLLISDDLYLVDIGKAVARRLTDAPGTEDEATFSPDGRFVAFLRGNDLFSVDTLDSKETRLTSGGGETVFNGRLDWVYQEEVYGRGTFKAFWWSPDSKQLAFISLDETKVPVYTLTDDRSTPQTLVKARYPLAGDPNPIARLGVVDLAGRITWSTDPYLGKETLLVQVGWSPDGQVLASFQDRVQTWLELRAFAGTESKVLIHEQSPAWQERLPLPRYLKDGSFLWESDRTGFRHIYHYSHEGTLLNPITSGNWCVEDLFGVDEEADLVYFAATERSFTGLDAYRAPIGDSPKAPAKTPAGKTAKRPKIGEKERSAPPAPAEKLVRITQTPGSHWVSFSPDFSMYLDSWTNAATPRQQSLFETSGRRLRLIDENPSPLYAKTRLGQVKFQQVKTRDGFSMETMLVLPPDFDAAKKYPVVQDIYGGPGFPSFRTNQVRDALSPSLLWFHFLAQQGYVVWVCDNRLASGKGAASAWGAFHHLYVQELEDQMDGLAWLKAQGWADMGRVALEGWSYGGSMTAYALTHSTAYKVGIAGAPVTDWRLYDSIYTERFMGLPKDNPDGYDASSILKASPHLSGHLLILHGTLDDNVHPANTIQFIDALQKASKPVNLMLLPGSAHGPVAPHHTWARFKATWDFIRENL